MIDKLKAISRRHLREGGRKAYKTLRRQGIVINHKKIERLWRENALTVPVKRRQRRCWGVFRPGVEWRRAMSVGHWLEPAPSGVVVGAVFLLGLSVVGGTSPVLILKEPPAVTSAYEVLEPETWVGRELPILKNIDIGEQLKEGSWLLVLYHHDCPACAEALKKIEAMARELEGNEAFLRFALIEVPPYGEKKLASRSANLAVGKLDRSKEWFVTTPVMVLIRDRDCFYSWQENVPEFEELLNIQVKNKKGCAFQSTIREGGERKGIRLK